jgi:phosphohistidine phosphatase
MKTLFVMRHAKARRPEKSAQDDHERPLTRRGKKQALVCGERLAEAAGLPDLLLASTARRCRSTAMQVIGGSGYRGQTRLLPELYQTTPAQLLALLSTLPDSIRCVLVIGHNPALVQLLHALVESEPLLPPGALANVELNLEHWEELCETTRGRLVDLWEPARGRK